MTHPPQPGLLLPRVFTHEEHKNDVCFRPKNFIPVQFSSITPILLVCACFLSIHKAHRSCTLTSHCPTCSTSSEVTPSDKQECCGLPSCVVSSLPEEVFAASSRFDAYKKATTFLSTRQGRALYSLEWHTKRARLPRCVLHMIRAEKPSQSGTYTGFVEKKTW